MESYNILKKELKLIDVEFNYLSKKIIEKNIIEHGKKFLNYKCKKKYNEKIFLSSFIITAFPHVVLNNINSEIDKQLFVHSSDLINNFLNLNNNFENILEKFVNYFEFWKKIDLKYISENVSESLFMINDIKDKLNEEEDLKIVSELEHKIKKQMKLISGESNINNYEDVENLFWNKYIKDLEHEPPNHELTIYLLKNIFDLLKEITPEKFKEEYFKEYNEYLDIDYLKHLIKNDVFEFNDFFKIFNYIINKLKEFQSKEDDEEFKKWEEDVFKKINVDNISYSEILPDIFKKILYRFNKIKNLKLIFSNLKNN
jgi:hypothetical protein